MPPLANMATLAKQLIFQHCPLPDSKTHIRLLKVLSVVKTRAIPVHCELTIFPITEAPPYRAISYTWGDESPLASIVVNGQQMDVRLNCEYALRQTSQHTIDRTGDFLVWIDSICVNQLDNDEKGAQVAMMGEIFKTATQVVACVGAHGDDSEFLYEFLGGEKARIQSVLRNFQETRTFYFLKLSRRELLTWRLKHPRSILIRLCKALANFLSRQYFHRVWVYQELFLGKDISVYCGNEILPISWIWVTSSIVDSWLWPRTEYFLFLNSGHTGMWSTLCSKIQDAMPLLLAGAREQPLMRLSSTISAVAELSCQDPRDRIYGILSIVEPVESHRFKPDYTKDRLDLAVEVLQKTRPEGIIALSDFHTTLASYANSVGLNLNLKEKPSQNLIVAKELRRSSMSVQETVPIMTGTRDDWSFFVGSRIFSQRDVWKLENQDERPLRHGLAFMSESPTMKKWLQSDKIPDASVGIHLPPEAQDGDWLLIPRSYHWTYQTQLRLEWKRVAFLARHYDSDRFEIVGKVLISATRWVSRWDKNFTKGASTFKFYCNPEDLMVLFDLCKWDHLWCMRKLEDSESFDAYFQTRFCGRRLSSYAVRTEN